MVSAKRVRVYGLAEGVQFAPTISIESMGRLKFCPRCSRRLKLRQGRRGEFFGCTGWPAWCSYTEPMGSMTLPPPY